MGGSISTAADNDEMIDNLIKSRYIRTDAVEKVFRSVDRAFYLLEEFQHTAYSDLAWRIGNLHLSAPCVYSEVLEHLKLESGHSFLNIGSGTGYLSTLAGLLLGPYGTNHGVEVHTDVVEYACKKLEQFKKTCNGVDIFEFSEPVFIVGNVFNLSQNRRYDRIYCGAACPVAHQEYIKKFMKIGGILVLPCEDDLLKITRTSEETWEVSSVLPVSFSTLQFPDRSIPSTISMPEPEPLPLQEICRSSVRTLLRSIVETEDPELTQKREFIQKTSSKKPYPQSNLRPVAFRLIRNQTRNYQNLNYNAFEALANLRAADEYGDGDADIASNFAFGNDSEDSESVPSSANSSRSSHRRNSDDISDAGSDNGQINESQSPLSTCDTRESRENSNDGSCCGTNNSGVDGGVGSSSSTNDNNSNDDVDKNTEPVASTSGSDRLLDSEHCEIKTTKKHRSAVRNSSNDGDESTSDHQPKKVMKREKLDSGISEESDDSKFSPSNESSSAECTNDDPMEIESDEDSDFTEDSSDEGNSSEIEPTCPRDYSDSVALEYRTSMEKKIQCLPLPKPMKSYLNYGRDFLESVQ